MKLQLPDVTLVCAECVNLERSIPIIEKCKELCDFKEVKLLTSFETDYEHRIEIGHLGSLVAYSIFVLKKLHEYINTSHLLIIQHDGWVVNPQAWNESWMKLDYIAPLFNQYDIMGAGGFSLRSTKLMKRVSEMLEIWDGSEKDAHRIQDNLGFYEDGVIAIARKDELIAEGFQFASLEEGAKFAQGGNSDYFKANPFGFHRGVHYEKFEEDRKVYFQNTQGK